MFGAIVWLSVARPLPLVYVVAAAALMCGCAPIASHRTVIVQDVSDPGGDSDLSALQSPRSAQQRIRQPVARVVSGPVKPPDTPEAASAAMEERYRRQEAAGRRWSKTICSGC